LPYSFDVRKARARFDSLFLFHTPNMRPAAAATESEVKRRASTCLPRGSDELPVADPKITQR